MKKILMAIEGGFILTFAIATTAMAQTSATGKNYQIQKGAEALSLPTNNDGSGKPGNVNAKAVRDFNKSYKNATNVDWQSLQDGFLAHFENGGENSKAAYDLKGNWRYTLTCGDEWKLPKDVRAIVKSTYYDYNIYQMQRIDLFDKTVFLVQIGDNKSFKQLRICDGELEVIGDYKKQQ